jgi:hypothetical protein
MVVNGQLHALAALPPGERTAGTIWVGGTVKPKAGLDAMEKRKFCPCHELNPGLPTRILSLYQLSYPDSRFFEILN